MTDSADQVSNEVPNEAQEQVETQVTTGSEKDAESKGWIPSDRYKGDPSKFRTAEEFLADYEQRVPLLRKSRDRLEGEVARLAEENRQTQEAMRQIVANLKQDFDSRLAREIDQLETSYAEAVAQGDTEKIKELGKKIRQVERDSTPQPQQQQQQREPEILTNWKAENQWYGTDRRSTALAEAIAVELRAEGYTGRALLKELDSRMREERPQLFTKEDRSERVETPSRSSKKEGGKVKVSDIDPLLLHNFVGKGKAWETPEAYVKYLNEGA